jgi:hypothetical protein
LATDPKALTEALMEALRKSVAWADYTPSLEGLPVPSPFAGHLEGWWTLHQSHCAACAAFGNYQFLRQNNHRNKCYSRDLMSFLHNGVLLPLTSMPPRAHIANRDSIKKAPKALSKEMTRLQEGLRIQASTREEATLVAPMTIAVKDSDLQEGLENLAKSSAFPPPPPSSEDLDSFNEVLEGAGVTPVKVRQCTDYSAEGMLNNYLYDVPFRFPEIDQLLTILPENGFLGKLDIRRCFNNIPLHPSQYHLLGLEYEGVVYLAMFILFGISLGPLIASILTAETALGLIALGIPTLPYIDDSAITGPSYEVTMARMDEAERVMGTLLGWPMSTDKREGPATALPYRGVVFDTVAKTLSISPARLRRLAASVDKALQQATHVNKWLSLLGKLEWVSTVLPPARLYLPVLWALVPYRRGKVCKHWKVKLSTGARAALEWFRSFFLSADAGSEGWSSYWPQAPTKWIRIFSDSAGSEGFGAVVDGEVIVGRWSEEGSRSSVQGGQSSSWKEFIPVFLALERVAPRLEKGAVVVVTTDNQGNAFALNKGRTNENNRPVFDAIHRLAFHYRIFLMADWVPREYNVLCDNLSKLPRAALDRLAPPRPRRPGDPIAALGTRWTTHRRRVPSRRAVSSSSHA